MAGSTWPWRTTRSVSVINVTVLLGNADGTFQTANNFGVGVFPDGVAVGDFNGDGKPDLARGELFQDSSVSVLLGNGDGTFGTPQFLDGGGLSPAVAVGDFNGDGKPDLASANVSGFAGTAPAPSVL